MKNSRSTDVTAAFAARDGRRFAFPVGTAFLVLAGLLLWRDRTTLAGVGAVLAGALYLAGLLLPARLGPVYRAWMGMAHAISRVTTPVFMAIVYFGVMTPTGWLMRLVGRKPIVHPLVEESYWVSVRDGAGTSGDMRRQF